MTEQTYQDMLLLWNTINSPMKAGSKWCQYTRPSINDAIEALKRVMKEQGFQYKESP